MNTHTKLFSTSTLPRCGRTLAWLLLATLLTALAATRSSAYWDCYDVEDIVHHEAVMQSVYYPPHGHWEWVAEETAVWREGPEGWSTIVTVYQVWVEESPGYWEYIEIQPAYDEVTYETHCDWVPDTE